MSKFFEKNIVSQKLLGLGIGYGIVIWHIELKIPKYTGCFIEQNKVNVIFVETKN